MKEKSVYLQSDFVELCECEDRFLHHVHTVILQQHVQIGDQSEKQLIISFTGRKKVTKKILKKLKYFFSQSQDL